MGGAFQAPEINWISIVLQLLGLQPLLDWLKIIAGWFNFTLPFGL